MEKYGTAGQATDDNIIWRRKDARIHDLSHTHTHTHTHTLYNISCLFFHCNFSYLNVPQRYVIFTLPVMLARFLNTAWPLNPSQCIVLTVKAKNAIFNLRELKTGSRRSRYGVVSIVTRARAGPSVVQFLVETKRRLSPPKVRSGSETRPASFSTGTSIISHG